MIDNSPASKEVSALINQKIDTLIESGKRMGGVDWFNQATGTILSVLIAVGFSPEMQRRIWDVWDALKYATQGIVSLIPALSERGALPN